MYGYIDYLPQQSHQFIYHVDSNSQNLVKLNFLTLSRLIKARLSIKLSLCCYLLLVHLQKFFWLFLSRIFHTFSSLKFIKYGYISYHQWLVHTNGSTNIYWIQAIHFVFWTLQSVTEYPVWYMIMIRKPLARCC